MKGERSFLDVETGLPQAATSLSGAVVRFRGKAPPLSRQKEAAAPVGTPGIPAAPLAPSAGHCRASHRLHGHR